MNKIKDTNDLVLVIATKSLIGSWVDELVRWYGDTVGYEVLHSDYLKKSIANWRPRENTKIVFSTVEVIKKVYKDYNIQSSAIQQEQIQGGIVMNRYLEPINPYLNIGIGPSIVYSIRWGCIFIDEIQTYTDIKTEKAKSLAALCARNRFALSGTPFHEPKTERFLGYYLILNIPDCPRTLPDCTKYMNSREFRGLNTTMIVRNDNPAYVQPEINEEIVSHTLSPEEQKIYKMMKDIMSRLNRIAKEYKIARDTENARRFSSYCLALLTYLRQALVSPLIPLASTAVDIASLGDNKSELSKIIMESIQNLELTDWLNDPSSICSNRITQIVNKLYKHRDEKVIVFSSYKSCLNVLQCYLGDFNVFTIDAEFSMQKRQNVVNEFERAENGVLLLSFQIGSNGLNLQTASTVLIVDQCFSFETTKQAIARINRMGQKAKKINIILFTSNTGIENEIFKKQKSKLLLYDDLKEGPSTKKIEKINMKEIINILENEKEDDNEKLIAEMVNLSLNYD